MGNCTSVDGQKWAQLLSTDAASSSTQKNLMRVLDDPRRAEFLKYMGNYTACASTPTHDMVQRADQYMRAPLHKNGPWASIPGEQEKPYLGCRRNYHILLTSGGWNDAERQTTPRNYDGAATTLPDGASYDSTPAELGAQTRIYRDSDSVTTIADWAFYSWATPLQTAGLSGSVKPDDAYTNAPETETFTNRVTGATATLEKYWNPRYDPATWPHMVTFSIGFGSEANPRTNYLMATGADAGAITMPTTMLPYGYDGNFADYANGTYRWQATSDRGHDMWHAALNSRGQLYAVEKATDLAQAFQRIIGQINTASEAAISTSATSGFNTSRADVGAFYAGYDPNKAWMGYVKSELIQNEGGKADNWGGATTATMLDALSPDSRVILSWNDDGGSGVAFRFEALSKTAQTWLNTDPASGAIGNDGQAGKDRLAYLRGDRSKEKQNGGSFRDRESAQGDIVNSVLWYASGAPVGNYALPGYSDFIKKNKNRPAMIYVGGNDGMLHGFAAADGSEKIAYVPRGVLPSVNQLTDPDYSHRYFVDGSPMTGDADLGLGLGAKDGAAHTPDWRTLLVGALGAGGKGYFVLDVTNPADFSEGRAGSLVMIERSIGNAWQQPACDTLRGEAKTICEQNKDIGNITAVPVKDEYNGLRATQITLMNNNRWAVVLGNGYNSANQRPVLLIQYLDHDKALKTLAVTAEAPGVGNASDNGLAAPRLVDIDGDNRPDIAYAGDSLGNMWKFDLTSDDDSQWKVAFEGRPLFTATARAAGATADAARDTPQPISTAPTVRANDRKQNISAEGGAAPVRVGGMMVAFGTGRNVTQSDAADTTVQTLYSVLDNTRYRYRNPKPDTGRRLEVLASAGGACPGSACIPAPRPLGRGVVEARLAKQTINTSGTIDASEELTPETWQNHNGWYADFPHTGERVLVPFGFYDGSNILAVFSKVPAASTGAGAGAQSCETTRLSAELEYLGLINIMDGKRPSIQLIDANGDGFYDQGDGAVSYTPLKAEPGSRTMIQSQPDVGKRKGCVNRLAPLSLACIPKQSVRPSWRQLQ
ncbi:MAG: pilus assembly protein PilC [Burkholderiaceae bacterium]|nr:pilus assembly protein PilC [Burkholderiaceae bacterium]